MKQLLALAVTFSALIFIPCSASQSSALIPPSPDQSSAIALPVEVIESGRQEQWFLHNGNIDVRNVVQPTLTPVLPIGSATGASVIVAPGGGFLGLAIDTEGWQVAKWLADRGVAAFVLKYRVLPTPESPERFEDEFKRMLRGEKVSFANPEDTPPEALADAMAALRYVREHAEEFQIDPHRVGFMGFSAGGFLMRSVILHAGPEMPAFAAAIYPKMTAMEVPVNAPPLFVAIAVDDFLLARGGLDLVDSWLSASKPIEFHLFSGGGHGFGLGRSGTTSQGWMELYYKWLEISGLL